MLTSGYAFAYSYCVVKIYTLCCLLIGRKNIRNQKTPDRIFFSVLEKMLLEVSSSSHDVSFHKAEQQLLSLRKVFLWFESNKHVLMKSDGVSQVS